MNENTTPTPHPEVEVKLTGRDGNAFAIIGAVERGLRQAGFTDDSTRWAFWAQESGSYDELLQRAMKTVTVL
jgi:hypothetical protein